MLSNADVSLCIVDISATTLAGRELKDAHVRHDITAAGAFERDFDEFEVCHEGMLDYNSPPR